MAAGPTVSRNQDATIYVGGFDEKVTEEMLWELFLQAGRIVNVHLPKDRISQAHQGYGFVELCEEADADYAVRIMNMIKLYGKPIRVNKALQSTPLSSLPPYPPMKAMLPPPPPPPPQPPIAFSPMTLPPPPLATLHHPQTPPPPPPAPQSSPSWNSFHQHLPPHMQPDHNRLGQLLPRLFVGLPPQYPLPAQCDLPQQHFLNRLPGPGLGPNPLEQRTNNFMQGDRPCPPFWNDCQDSRRR